MGRDQLTRTLATLLIAALAAITPATLAADDTGLLIEGALEKKFNKKADMEFAGQLRTRNDFRTVDRVSLALGGSYKITSWLKGAASYQLLIDNNKEKLTYNLDASGKIIGNNNWRPSYWGTRHRLMASLTATLKWQRVAFSLREMYRYTYRPEVTTTRYDFDNGWWEDTKVNVKHEHCLRSRLRAEWNIPKSKFTPWIGGELFNTISLDKYRLQAGVNYSLRKRHTFGLGYRFQHSLGNDDPDVKPDEHNIHLVTLTYKFKF